MAYTMTLSELAQSLGQAGQLMHRQSEDLLTQVATRIAEVMRAEAPVDSGKLRDSIDIVSSPGRRVIGPNVAYADFVELGTAPHKISAKPGNVLAFPVGGKTIYAAYVNHPGTAPNPFVKRSLEQVQGEIAKAYAEAGAKAVFGRAS